MPPMQRASRVSLPRDALFPCRRAYRCRASVTDHRREYPMTRSIDRPRSKLQRTRLSERYLRHKLPDRSSTCKNSCKLREAPTVVAARRLPLHDSHTSARINSSTRRVRVRRRSPQQTSDESSRRSRYSLFQVASAVSEARGRNWMTSSVEAAVASFPTGLLRSMTNSRLNQLCRPPVIRCD
ncbi:hypothetical protein ALC57_02778 [Trachymyrmex cornetzi]|uniref:Uncharacterized protein n=1 Tax=Trachymyrmex cornetzi TaxID=471704 RepID=A0A195EIM5_9HYME|nr:hypothetical protein ALC57_02778 [Trachymyrmex cornetzi]